MIAPVIPYAIKGVTWYQGESNANQAMEYRTLFPLMITDWRQRWGLGDFPFLFVQLACFSPGQNWALLRESQLKTLALPDTGMASAVDIGDPTFIHPQDKLDVGLRLALAARHIAYGQNIVFSGPIYDSMKVEGGAIRISFTQAGGGLVVGHAPWIPVSVQKNPVSTTELESFTIAGADKKWVPAQARIDGNSVVVSSADVTQPVAVRYGWANAPRCNLYNKEMLPASPFRTDDWPELPPAASATTTAAPATPASTSPVHSPSTTGNQ
jgi:sialate O-acetylesterase